MKFTQKYAIVQLFEDMPVGTQFSSNTWPLHATIADTFAVEWDAETLASELKKALTSYPAAVSIAEDDVFFGADGEVRVTLLQKTDNLLALHREVIKVLKNGGWKPNDPQFALEGFLPHATVQKHARLHKGEKVSFTTLAVIDMFPESDPYQRRVVETVAMSGAMSSN